SPKSSTDALPALPNPSSALAALQKSPPRARTSLIFPPSRVASLPNRQLAAAAANLPPPHEVDPVRRRLDRQPTAPPTSNQARHLPPARRRPALVAWRGPDFHPRAAQIDNLGPP
ncbi:unnamed protein product, partial [Urochloa humidicola]